MLQALRLFERIFSYTALLLHPKRNKRKTKNHVLFIINLDDRIDGILPATGDVFFG